MFLVHIAGHLGKDPEVRYTSNGQKVTSFSMAVNQRKGGEETTVWARVTIWGDKFDKMVSFMKKGSGVIVSGRLNPSIYTDKEGRAQLSLDVTAEMMEFSPFGKNERQDGSDNSRMQSSGSEQSVQTRPAHTENQSGFASGQGAEDDFDEDSLPF